MSEPYTLWTERIDKKYRDLAPQVVEEFKGISGPFWTFDGNANHRITSENSKGASTDFERPGGWDPAARLKDMELDGIAGTVLYSTRAFFIYNTRTPSYRKRVSRSTTIGLLNFVSYSPDHFVGLALISLFDTERAVAELERCRNLGLKGAMIWAAPPSDYPQYWSADWDPVWRAASELDMPLALHTNTAADGNQNSTFSPDNARNWGSIYTQYVMAQSVLQRSILALTFGGVFERFPGLKVVCAEGDISWMPALMARADKYYASRIRRGHDYTLAATPAEYLTENVWISFIKDPLGLELSKKYGNVNRIMWSTDYPHPAAFFPNSLDVFTQDFASISDEATRKICHDNVADLFGFEL